MSHKLSADSRDELTAFFNDYAAQLFGYASWLTQCETPLAEDLVQDAFQAAAHAWQYLRTLREGQRKQWLRTTLRNRAVSTFRHAAVCRAHEQRDLQQAFQEDTYTLALSKIAVEQCWAVIRRMPLRQHEIAVMR